MQDFIGTELVKWYRKNKRALPWRDTKNPFYIWLSEIILQQTRVEQGLPYYNAFVKKFPTVQKLAAAKEDEVLKLWQGLGYYTRARNLHLAAKIIVQQYKGVFPSTYKEVLALPGIGEYTAAAICSFAYNMPYAVVDGNVFRFLSRLFSIETEINSTQGKKEFTLLAQELLLPKNPGTFNQAIMEFGSQICKPSLPACPVCIFNTTCTAFANQLVDQLPVKKRYKEVKTRYFYYFLLEDENGYYYAQQRLNKDIWQGLYELYLIKSDKPIPTKLLLADKNLNRLTGEFTLWDKHSLSIKHQLSHQLIHARFYHLKTTKAINRKYRKTSGELITLAWPRLLHKYLIYCGLE